MSLERRLSIVQIKALELGRKTGLRDPEKYAADMVAAYRECSRVWQRYLEIPTRSRLLVWQEAVAVYMDLQQQTKRGEV